MTNLGDPRSLDPRALRAVAVRVATAAARLLADAVHQTRTEVDTKSTSTDMVTEMDRASEALLVERLLALRPDDAIVGEEGADHAGTTGVRWVIDPLDGTTNYLYRYPGWNVSVGATIDDVPVAGAVVVPATGERFVGAQGLGSTRNGAPLAVGAPAPLERCLVGTGFNYDPDLRIRQATALASIIGRVRDIRRGGAAAADLCAVAAGSLDAYFEHGLAPWDRVAGFVIASEAGAETLVVDPTPLGRDCTIAAHPARLDELLSLLADAGLLDGTMPARRGVHEARWEPYGDTNPHGRG